MLYKKKGKFRNMIFIIGNRILYVYWLKTIPCTCLETRNMEAGLLFPLAYRNARTMSETLWSGEKLSNIARQRNFCLIFSKMKYGTALNIP
jgi:hypothetical protein